MAKPAETTKKPETAYAPKPEAPKKGHTPLPDACHSWGCKTKPHKFNFCSEHYEQFKFGLIKKTGDPVPDYEKKFEHYEAYKKRVAARKAA